MRSIILVLTFQIGSPEPVQLDGIADVSRILISHNPPSSNSRGTKAHELSIALSTERFPSLFYSTLSVSSTHHITTRSVSRRSEQQLAVAGARLRHGG